MRKRVIEFFAMVSLLVMLACIIEGLLGSGSDNFLRTRTTRNVKVKTRARRTGKGKNNFGFEPLEA